jgi:hypothetical protein
MSREELMHSYRSSMNRGSSAYRRVCWDSSKRKWVANIGVPGFRQVNLGSYVNEADALPLGLLPSIPTRLQGCCLAQLPQR